MPVELIGEVWTPGADSEWIVAECEVAIRRLIEECGPPPMEMELDIQWQEHELGSYPMLVLIWEDGMRGAPWDYIEKCENALRKLEDR